MSVMDNKRLQNFAMENNKLPLCCMVPQKLKGKFYRTAIKPAMLYGAECWHTKRRHVQQISVAEMHMLRWICGHKEGIEFGTMIYVID